MDILAVVAVLVFLIVVPVVVANRDLFFNRSGPSAKRAHSDPPLPFLIIPPSPNPAGEPNIIPAGIPRQRRYTPQSYPSSPAQQQSQSQWADQHHSNAGLDDVAPDATIVFNRPIDEPIQILPGRLHVLSGDAAGEDLRLFGRIGEPAQIVVGREAGPPHRHVTLQSPTVSRRHARIDFANGQWSITNLSATNPVLVNDRVLTNGGSSRKLSDGDRIELGEVALRFLAS